MPAAIFVIPYADLMFAIIRRTRAGKPIMVADRQHLHHRLLNIGHSYRQSVLLMYLWAALFSVTVVSLSLVRSPSAVFAAATGVAVLALLPATMPRLRPWRVLTQRNKVPTAGSALRAPATGSAPRVPATGSAPRVPATGSAPRPPAPSPLRAPSPLAAPYPDPLAPSPADSYPQAAHRPGTGPFVSPAPFSGQVSSPRQASYHPRSEDDPLDRPDPFSQAQPPDTWPS
jgi:hypothetical protein